MRILQALLNEYREMRARQHELALNENAALLRLARLRHESDLLIIAEIREELADLTELSERQANHIVQLEMDLRGAWMEFRG